MIHIEKGVEPEFWKGFRKKHPKIHYAQLEDTEEGKEIRQKLRKHLIAEQYSVCCYCCREIDSDNSLNEHIKPQSVFSEQTMDYENIIASCRGKTVPADRIKTRPMTKLCLFLRWIQIVKNIFRLHLTEVL